MENRPILLFSIPLSVLLIFVSCVGFFKPGFYAAETPNWEAQTLGQDLVDLFIITPCLIITSILAYRKNVIALHIWGGIILYITYTFVLYCFCIHFNKLFVLYCVSLGLSFYAMVYYLYTHVKLNNEYSLNNRWTRWIGIYFISLAVIFYLLWLAEIIPAIIDNITPRSVTDAGLITNGVHVIDLSVILPGILLTGILMLKKVQAGQILAPVFLSFFILMDITIGVLAIIMNIKGIQNAGVLPVIMGVLALISTGMLIGFFRNMNYTIKY